MVNTDNYTLRLSHKQNQAQNRGGKTNTEEIQEA